MRCGVGWIMIVVAGLGVPVAAVAAESGVAVVRGTATASAAAPSAVGLPAILRGRPAASPRRASTPPSPPEYDSAGWIATGGDTLWLVERQGDGIVGCWLQGSARAGETVIRCARDSWR